MTQQTSFELEDFMPYLLNQAADVASRDFERTYKNKYGMLRTEWRVVFHLGLYGDMTAKEICDRARTHKTKVSRAVRALADKSYLSRETVANDRRHETLSLTKAGKRVFDDLYLEAQSFDAKIMADLDDAERMQIRRILTKIAKF